jgi:hypothetical protein
MDVFKLLFPAQGLQGSGKAFRSLQQGINPTEVLTWAVFGWEPTSCSFMGGDANMFFEYKNSNLQSRARHLIDHLQARPPLSQCSVIQMI